MARYNNKYQYETSPRKLQPEYEPIKKKYPKKNTTSKNKNTKNNQKVQNKNNIKILISVIAIFAMLFAVSYRDALITQEYSEIKGLKTELSDLEKENKQLEVNIESKTNLGAIEQKASKELGLKKLDDSKTVYVSLDKQDYIESSTEEVKLNESNWFEEIINKVKNIF